MTQKKNAIIVTSSIQNVDNVIAPTKILLKEHYNLYNTILCKENLEQHLSAAQQAEYIFSTWGMEHFDHAEIRRYFPRVRCLFYAAGSVQQFAREFLDCGIRVFSAWKANAIPVAEYTHAQILLAAKGFFGAMHEKDSRYSNLCGGIYSAQIGLIGVGSIGRLVAQKLKANHVEVFYYDPFLPADIARELTITPCTLEDMFSQCDVISNHLPNKDELTGILSGALFAKMKPYAAFINTGRGRQVDHEGLLAAMLKVPTRTALLDVTDPEPLPADHGLRHCSNVIITPHIAGSLGREVVRMADYMAEEAERMDLGETPLYEVTAEQLRYMA